MSVGFLERLCGVKFLTIQAQCVAHIVLTGAGLVSNEAVMLWEVIKRNTFDMYMSYRWFFRVTLKSREPYRTFRDVTPDPLTVICVT
jgi:hypothetical protein